MKTQPEGPRWATTPEVVVVIPCYDEAARLVPEHFDGLFEAEGLGAVFVDDGSSDGTGGRIDAVAARHPGRVVSLRHSRNQGKAAAVTTGAVHAIDAGASWVGYLDADLSTPVSEWVRLTTLRATGIDAVLASRVRLLGRDVERRPERHVIGRVFATWASVLLGLGVYDTQCGAKLFRVTPTLEEAFAAPFRTRWLFDVELLARLLYPDSGAVPVDPQAFVEMPLRTWRDVAGSSLGIGSTATVARDALYLAADVRRRRRAR